MHVGYPKKDEGKGLWDLSMKKSATCMKLAAKLFPEEREVDLIGWQG